MESNLIKTKGDIMLERAETQFWAYQSEIGANEKTKDAILLDNVQFIYELSLAELELRALGAEYEVTNGLREFRIINRSEDLLDKIKRRSSYFRSVNGSFTDYFRIIQKNQTRSVNQYLTHWFYPYKGKFHPQMIRALLNIIGLKKGDTIYEPFSGSGTTCLEAQLLGINSFGMDISPLCTLQGRVKVESFSVIENIEKAKKDIFTAMNTGTFGEHVNLYKILDQNISDEKVRNFYKLAWLIAVSDSSRRGKDLKASFLHNVNAMIASVRDYSEIKKQLNLDLGEPKIEIGDCRNANLPDSSADGIITSPPYSIALDYVKNDAHSLEEMGYDLPQIRESFVGVRGNLQNRVELYNKDIEMAYSEMYRVLKPDKYAVIVIGNATYQGREIKTVEFTINCMNGLGFKLVKNINKIIFGLYNVMKKENILIFQKQS